MKELLGDDPQAFARHTDPGTSREAAARISSKVNKLEQAVADSIKAAGVAGRTWDEIAADTGLDKASVSPRFKPLRKKGVIRAKVDDASKEVRRDRQTVWVAV
jgi:hypothetical protein